MKDSATHTTASALKLQNLKTNAKDDTAISALGEIQGNALNLVNSVQASKQKSKLEQTVSPVLSDDCVTMKDNTITYNNCSGGGGSINGTITIKGDTITVDLKITTNTGGQTLDIIWKGSVTVTETMVDGTLKFSYTGNYGGYDMAYNATVDYNAIQLQEKCPVGGSLDVTYDVDIKNLPSGAKMPEGYGGGSVTVKFGPNCGDMKIYG